MTDREYLELAAKAAGYVLVWGDKYKLGDDEIDCTDIPYIRSEQPDEGDVYWNPLTDDGDALRLAVRCGIVVEYRREVPACFTYHYALKLEVMQRNDELDPLSATRRAIVRAAAEIGKGLQPLPTDEEIREEWT